MFSVPRAGARNDQSMQTSRVRYALSVVFHAPINLGLLLVVDEEDGSVLVVGGAR
jgi:hypothetical protein